MWIQFEEEEEDELACLLLLLLLCADGDRLRGGLLLYLGGEDCLQRGGLLPGELLRGGLLRGGEGRRIGGRGFGTKIAAAVTSCPSI